MFEKKKAVILLSWLQLIFSVLLAVAIVFGYLTSRASLGQFIESLTSSIVSVSNVVGMTAETLETRQSFVDSTKKMLIVSRALIKELNKTTVNQARQAPQYLESVRASSAIAISLSNALGSVGDALMFSTPTGVQMEGIRPVVVMSRPLEKQGNELKIQARNIKVVSDNLLNFSVTFAKDGEKLGAAFVATSEQALRLLEETEKTLDRLQMHDLPKALDEMKSTSENLRSISQEVNIAGNIAIAVLIFGLLLSGWCFLNSLSLLIMANLFRAEV